MLVYTCGQSRKKTTHNSPKRTRRPDRCPLATSSACRPNQFPHQQPHVLRSHLHRIALLDVVDAAQPGPVPAARFTDMAEAPLHELAALLLQALAACPLKPAPVVQRRP